eukprot:jgi/Mesvir1/20961/Mv08030-RA.1
MAMTRGSMALFRGIRTFAGTRHMSTAAAAPSINWDAISAVLQSDESKQKLTQFRSLFMKEQRDAEIIMASNPPAINWDAYRQELGSALVDNFKAAYEAEVKDSPTLADSPNYKKLHATTMAKFAELAEKAKQVVVDNEKRIAELQARVTQLNQEMKNLQTITIDEILAKDPELKKRIDDEILADNWDPVLVNEAETAKAAH